MPSPFRLLACVAVLHLALPAQAVTANAPVSRVVLYPGSALVERVVAVRAGDPSLEIPGLPANFNADSLQIDADAGIEVGEVVWRDSARSAPLNAEEARLEKEVLRLGDRLASIDVDRKAAERALKYLDTLASPSESPATGSPAQTLQTIQQGSIQAARRILDIDMQKRDLERELQARQRDLEQVRPPVDQVRQLSIRVNARNNGKLRIRYLFADAGWRPAYRALLDSEKKVVDIERVAQIAQRSGEDWSQVSLQLSTGEPRQRVNGPLPPTWNVSLQPEMKQQALAAYAPAPAARVRAVMAPEGRAAKAEDKPLFEVAVTQAEFATEYSIPGAISLPADGRKVAVSLGRVPVPVKLAARVAPRQEKAAYLVARGSLPEGVWPAGEMQFYRNGAYIGSAGWNAASNDKLELSFGRDELIRVSSRSLAANSGSAGFTGRDSERRIADAFTVSNRHKGSVDIVVVDASPVSRDEQIEVSRNFTPPVSHQDWDGRSGVVAWESTLEGGASREFTADYRIRWPKERQIIGVH